MLRVFRRSWCTSPSKFNSTTGNWPVATNCHWVAKRKRKSLIIHRWYLSNYRFSMAITFAITMVLCSIRKLAKLSWVMAVATFCEFYMIAVVFYYIFSGPSSQTNTASPVDNVQELHMTGSLVGSSLALSMCKPFSHFQRQTCPKTSNHQLTIKMYNSVPDICWNCCGCTSSWQNETPRVNGRSYCLCNGFHGNP